jgi:TIR domain
MTSRQPDAFLSHTRFDDRHGEISAFRKHLEDAVREVTGEPFEIFQDIDGIGEHWTGKLDQMLDKAWFFIPVLTPTYFNSTACRYELEKFLRAEAKRGRNDLVLPIYYIECPVVEDDDFPFADPEVQRRLVARKWSDWRAVRFEAIGSRDADRLLRDLAQAIARARAKAQAVERAHEGTADVLPNGLAAAIAVRQHELAAVRRPQATSPTPSTPSPESPAKVPSQRRIVYSRRNMWLVWAVVSALIFALGVKLLGIIFPALLGMTRDEGSSKQKTSKSRTYPADCSIYAPEEVPIGQTILVQVFLHPPQLFASLDLDLPEGARVGFELRASDLIVSDNGIGEIRWHNRLRGLQFHVTAPPDCEIGSRNATLRVFVQGAPAGRIHFVIRVAAKGASWADGAAKGRCGKALQEGFHFVCFTGSYRSAEARPDSGLIENQVFPGFSYLKPGRTLASSTLPRDRYV